MEANASGMIHAKHGTPNAIGGASCGSRGVCLVFAAEEASAREVRATRPVPVGSPTAQAAISEIRLHGVLVTP